VMSVISHSLARVDGRYISAYIVVSAHITVIRAISHSIWSLFWRNICRDI